MSQRPTYSDPAVQERGLDLAVELVAEWSDEITASEWKELFQRHGMGGNGYELARRIDHALPNTPDAELVALLDDVEGCRWRAHEEAVKQWVAEHDIKPDLGVGQRVHWSDAIGEAKTGTIWAIDAPTARYIIKPDGDDRFANGGGHLIAYERVTADEASA